MDRLVTPKTVAERYGCSLATARKYIRRCNPHMEKPLATTQSAFADWENGRTVCQLHLTIGQLRAIVKRQEKNRVKIPRRKD